MSWWRFPHKAELVVDQFSSRAPAFVSEKESKTTLYYLTTVYKGSFRVHWWMGGDELISHIDTVVFPYGPYEFPLPGVKRHGGIPLDKTGLVDMDELRDLLPDPIAKLVVAKFNVCRMRLD